MTKKEAIAKAREAGCTLQKTLFDEYRVNIKGGTEETAYYTDDLNDAVVTAQEMGRWRPKPRS